MTGQQKTTKFQVAMVKNDQHEIIGIIWDYHYKANIKLGQSIVAVMMNPWCFKAHKIQLNIDWDKKIKDPSKQVIYARVTNWKYSRVWLFTMIGLLCVL